MQRFTKQFRLLITFTLVTTISFACGGDSSTGPETDPGEQEPTTGALAIQLATQGSSPDPDGYAVAVDGGTSQDVQTNDTLTVDDLSEGSHDITVQKAASNCTPPSGVSGSVTAGDTTAVSVSVQCEASLQDRVAFYTQRGGTAAVYTMNQDGSDPQELTGQDIAPWDVSEDGTKILGVVDPFGGSNGWEIAVIEANGSVTQLTSNSSPDVYPHFEPGDSTIVFTRRDSSDALYRMDVDGSDIREVTDLPREINASDVSPDNGRIAFGMSDTSASTYSLHSVNSSGGDMQTLVADTTNTQFPAYSPSGDRIAYEVRASTDSLKVMNADGTGVQTLATDSGAYLAVWMPSGDAIMYMNTGDIYRINDDGTGLTNLTAHSAEDGYPAVSTWTSGSN